MKLYIYDHCPFCVRARMIFGLKNMEIEQIVLLDNDYETPIRMIGKKMLPILEKDDGSYNIESHLDKSSSTHSSSVLFKFLTVILALLILPNPLKSLHIDAETNIFSPKAM